MDKLRYGGGNVSRYVSCIARVVHILCYHSYSDYSWSLKYYILSLKSALQ